MENKLIIVNQKNTLNYDEVINFLNDISTYKIQNIIFCPSYPYLTLFKEKGYTIGSQDVSLENEIMTGNVTATMLKSIGVSYVFVAHSERRKKENNKDFIQKIKNVTNENLNVIFCISNESDANIIEVLKNQIEDVFDYLTEDEKNKIMISYEPKDKIGTNKIMDKDKIEEIVKALKQYFNIKYKINPKILYGGGINADNIEKIKYISYLDGYLIGSSGCNSNDFLRLMEKLQ